MLAPRVAPSRSYSLDMIIQRGQRYGIFLFLFLLGTSTGYRGDTYE